MKKGTLYKIERDPFSILLKQPLALPVDKKPKIVYIQVYYFVGY